MITVPLFYTSYKSFTVHNGQLMCKTDQKYNMEVLSIRNNDNIISLTAVSRVLQLIEKKTYCKKIIKKAKQKVKKSLNSAY